MSRRKSEDGGRRTEGGEQRAEEEKRSRAEFLAALVLMAACCSGAAGRSRSFELTVKKTFAGGGLVLEKILLRDCETRRNEDDAAARGGLLLVKDYKPGDESGPQSAGIVASAKARFGDLFLFTVDAILKGGAA